MTRYPPVSRVLRVLAEGSSPNLHVTEAHHAWLDWAFELPHGRSSRFFLLRHDVTKPWSACAISADRLGAHGS